MVWPLKKGVHPRVQASAGSGAYKSAEDKVDSEGVMTYDTLSARDHLTEFRDKCADW